MSTDVVPVPDLSALARREAWLQLEPDLDADPEIVETHLSLVFLTRDRVYKFRRAVDLGFVRFATRSERNADCLREVALNRRLAPDVYLGIAPLLSGPDGLRVGPIGETLADRPSDCEHCVVMRRLPDDRRAASLLAAGALTPGDVDRLAERIADFHARNELGRPAPMGADEWRETCVAPALENLSLLAGHDWLDPALRSHLEQRVRGLADRLAPRFEERRREGRAVEGHGDLQLQHVYFEGEDTPPIAIDCVEFNASLRRIDGASDVAFASMDFAYRGSDPLGERLLARYADLRDDFGLYDVVDFFQSYRAAVRGKVASIAADDDELAAPQRERAARSARDHLTLARERLEPRRAARLVLTAGVVGSGKSTLAAELAAACDGVVIASDRVRKRQLGLAPQERAPGSAYEPAAKSAVYAGLLERAAPVTGSGRVAILDATFDHERERRRAIAWARERGLPVEIVEARCDPAVARERLARRAAAGGDASDAGPERLAASRATFEPVQAQGAHRTRIATDEPEWRERARDLAAAWKPAAGGRDEA